MDKEHFDALKIAKRENYQLIYGKDASRVQLNSTAKPMMEQIYGQLLDDLKQENKKSPIFTHHINYVNKNHYFRDIPYEHSEPNQLVVDYIASMTDDYFVDLYHYLYPDSSLSMEYLGYFDSSNYPTK